MRRSEDDSALGPGLSRTARLSDPEQVNLLLEAHGPGAWNRCNPFGIRRPMVRVGQSS